MPDPTTADRVMADPELTTRAAEILVALKLTPQADRLDVMAVATAAAVQGKLLDGYRRSDRV